MRIHYFQHVEFEGLGCIETWAKQRGFDVTATKFFAGESPPASLDGVDWLIAMGGPMNIYEEDRYPWLAVEKEFIRRAVAANVRFLGICLGAQLLADVLGGKGYRNSAKEIGWRPIEPTPAARESPLFASWPGELLVFHWHGETFYQPPGTVHVAQNSVTTQQAFLYGDRIVGLQFHMESTPESVAALIENCGDELVDAPYIQSAQQMLADPARFGSLNREMFGLLDRMAELK